MSFAIKITLSLFLFLATQNTWAERWERDTPFVPKNCPEIDLNISPSPLDQIPIYDQDGSGTCYAFTASQLADYYRIKNGEDGKNLIHPVYAAWLTYFKSPILPWSKRPSLDGGFIDDVTNAVRKNGICSNSEVKDRLQSLKYDTGLTDAQLLFLFEVLYKYLENSVSMSTNEFYEKFYTAIGDVNAYVYPEPITCSQADDFRVKLEKLGIFKIAPTAIFSKIFEGCQSTKINIPELRRIGTISHLPLRNSPTPLLKTEALRASLIVFY